MVYFLNFLSLLLLLAFQTSFLHRFSLGGVQPDLVLIFAMYAGIRFPGNAGVGMGFISGLAQDGLSGGLLGVNSLSKGLVALYFSALRNQIMVEGWIPICVFLFLASLFNCLVFYGIWIMLFLKEGGAVNLLPAFLGASLYTAVLGPPFFWIFDRFNDFIGRKFQRPAFRSS